MEEESGKSGFGGFVKFWHTAEMRGEVVAFRFFFRVVVQSAGGFWKI